MSEQQIIDLYPPILGIMVDMVEVPDQVFAQKMVGDGVAIDPLSNKIYAPIDGVIKSVHQSKHAILLSTDDGLDILIHIGLETVSLDGKGFNIHVNEGDRVKRGIVIGEFDLDYIARCAKTLITPVVLIDFNKSLFSFWVVSQYETSLATPIIQIKRNSVVSNSGVSDKTSANLLKSSPIMVKNLYGLHARPSAAICTIARNYDSEVLIAKNGKKVNAKSIISLLGLSVNQNDIIYIYASHTEIIDKLTEVLTDIYDNPIERQVINEVLPTSSQLVIGSKYYGISASNGKVCGVLAKYTKPKFIIKEDAEDLLFEKNRFYDALNTVRKDVEANLKNLADDDQMYRGILEAHLQILLDPDLASDCLKIISHNKSAAYALSQVIEKDCQLISRSDNSLLIERLIDFRDLRDRILSVMDKIEVEHTSFIGPTILLIDELTPTDLVKLDRNVVGLISITGGTTSHVAIMARAKCIPLLIGVDRSILEANEDSFILLNSNDGYVNLMPDDSEILEANNYQIKLKHKSDLDLQDATFIAKTKDEYQIECFANITNINDSECLTANGADGIGLFRTEFIYFNRKNPPNINEQYKIYSEIASNINNTPFVIRTLDAGGEKQIAYLKLPHEANPILGVRGIRLSIQREELFIDQLTAIVKINRPNIKIMLPMVSSIEEYRWAKEILAKLKAQYEVNNYIELGIMVEVPSAALLSDVFAKEVDFFSIGTNDLSQYTLAIDREHANLSHQIDHLHPAVIRNINMVVRGAKTCNRPVSVCGLMASEKLAIPLLIGLGIDQLSMNMNVIAENKAFIRSLMYSDCVAAATKCLELSTALDVRQYLMTKFVNAV